MAKVTITSKKKIERVDIGDVLVIDNRYSRMIIREDGGKFASLNIEEGKIAWGGFDSIDALLKFYEDDIGERDIVVVKAENVEVIV